MYLATSLPACCMWKSTPASTFSSVGVSARRRRKSLTFKDRIALVPGNKFAGVLYVEAAACQHVFVSGHFRPPRTNKPEYRIPTLLLPGYKFAGVLYVEAAACQHVFVSGRFRPPTANKPDT